MSVVWLLACTPLWAGCSSPPEEPVQPLRVEAAGAIEMPTFAAAPRAREVAAAPEPQAVGSPGTVEPAQEPRARKGHEPALLVTDTTASPLDEAPARAEAEPDVIPAEAYTPGSWALHVADGLPPVIVPADELLVFSVILDFGVLGEPRVGTVTLSGRVDRETAPDGTERISGFLGSHAKGGYLGYYIDNRLGVRLIDQPWPRMDYSDIETGTGPHLRTLQVGTRDGAGHSLYRRDGHCKDKKCGIKAHMKGGRFLGERGYHCRSCRLAEHRVWRPEVALELPADSFDMLSAVYLARTALAESRAETSFHLIDGDDLWEITVLKGRGAVIETPSGRYGVNEVKLITRPASGEENDSSFRGMFGLHGTIEIWFHAGTGVPVSIRGTVPVGPLSFEVRIELEDYSGTPASFGPLR